MAFSLNRLTLYALINALEEDLRLAIATHLPINMPLNEVYGEELLKSATARFFQENGDTSYLDSFTDLLDYIDFPDSFKLLQTHKSFFTEDQSKNLKTLIPYFEKVVPVRNRVCHGRPLHYDDLSICLDLISNLQNRVDLLWRSVSEVQQKIADNPGWVLELNLPAAPKDRISHNLPIPDFDETGFMGRKNNLGSLKDMIAGPYPVISIIGEGGLGKSALALKIGYDLLDDENSGFDAIVWSSAKSNTVTAQEIKKIEEAVTDSLGMFKNVSTALLGDTKNDDVIGEIIEYLREFKILLILDNLETVIDGVLKNFFNRLPSGSKVLTTSRIGLGEFERRLNLAPMSNPEASTLMRAVSNSRGVTQLSTCPQKRLNDYSNKLKNNPGFIKWFVASVQSGVRPEKVLLNTDIFLDFCLENVYVYLEDDGRKVLDVMQSVSRPLSMPEISYISTLDPVRLQRSIHQLLQTNMLNMISAGNEISPETRYGLSELARAYLIKRHAVGSKDYHRFKTKEREINEMHGQVAGGFRNDEASVYRIAVRSRSDTVIASYLIEALNSLKNKDGVKAIELVEKAKELSPGFYEVHRVDAWINAQLGNILAAKTAYEAAYEMASEDVPLMIWYGGFLQRYENDYELALEIFNKALKLSRSNPHALVERARVYLHLEAYDKARNDLLELKPVKEKISKRLSRVYWDLLLQISSRQAQRLGEISDYQGILECVERYLSDLDATPRDCIDYKQIRRLKSVKYMVNLASRHLFDAELAGKCKDLEKRCLTELEYLGVNFGSEGDYKQTEEDSDVEVFEGIIVLLQDFYGFLKSQDFPENVFFNKSEFSALDQIQLIEGKKVSFRIGRNRTGQCAIGCKIL